MSCHCGDRRRQLAAAGAAIKAGRVDAAKAEVRAVGRSLTDDTKAFAQGLRARLGRR